MASSTIKSLAVVAIAVLAVVGLVLAFGGSSSPPRTAKSERAALAHASTTQEAAPAPALQSDECDAIAADPEDPDRPRSGQGGLVDGVPAGQLDLRRVVEACRGSAGDSTEQLRRQYQLARAQMLMGSYEASIDTMRKLCVANYGAACYRMAIAHRRALGGVTQNDFKAFDFVQRAQRAGVPVPTDFAAEVESAATPWSRVQGRPLLYALYGGQYDQIPDTVSTRRYFYTLFAQIEKQNGQWFVNTMSNQDNLHARQTIWPVMEDRLKLTVDDGKRIFEQLPSAAAKASDWRSVASTIASNFFAVQTVIQNANSIQVATGAKDAQTLFEWFGSCGNCNTARSVLQSNLAHLMSLWAVTRPKPDSDALCRYFYVEPPANCMPLNDYQGADTTGQSIGVLKKPGAH